MTRHRRFIFSLETLEDRRLLAAGPDTAGGSFQLGPSGNSFVTTSRGTFGAFAAAEDVGAPAQAGSTTYDNGTYTITAGGSDIGGTSDQFHFAYNNWDADGSIVARVASLANTNAAAKAGLMFRAGPGAGAAFVGVFVTPGVGLTLLTRPTDGAAAGQTTLFGFPAPRFLKLTRAGDQVTAFHSANGVTWTQVGSPQTVALGSDPLVGLAVTSRNVAATTTATFTNVSVLLPPNFNDNDIGAPAPPGFATHDPTSNTFVVSGGGTGVGGTSDQFNFANHNVTGDGSITALVHGIDAGAAPSARAGLMMRDDLTAGAKFAGVSLSAQNNLAFQWRPTTGAAAMSTSVANVTGPVWLRLTRQDDVFRAYYSSNATQWTQIGASQSIAMTGATAPAGMFVTSGDGSTLASATFAPVSIVQSGWSNASIGSPALAGSATYDAPSNTYTLVAGGVGIGGADDEFNFASRSMTGDGSVIAYVNGIAGDAPDAKAGVMIRASATPSSAFAGVFVTPTGGVSLQWRESEGGPVQQASVGSATAPVSLRLTRAGNDFTAAYSTNGTTWTTIGGSRTIPMPAGVFAGLALTSQTNAALARATFSSVGIGKNLAPGAGVYSAADELFLHDLSQRSVRFFYDETNPSTGLVPDYSNANGGGSGVSSIAAIGFGLSALAIGDERGWLSHDAAYQRALTTLNFLYNTVPHVNGWFYHFLNPSTGARAGTSELSSVDTALLMAGVLNVAQHWEGTPLADVAHDLYNRVNWPWMQTTSGLFRGAWSPEGGFSSHVYGDFSEAALIYLLGLGSPTHPIARSSWNAWSRTPVINYSGFNFVTAGTRALFTVQYPQAWFDLRGLSDSTGLNYYNNAATATLAQRQMALNLSGTWPQYGANNWGWTAADGPNGYTVWGGPPPTSNIDGSLVPTAPGGSLAFTPRQSVDALRHMHDTYGSSVYRRYGFVDAFNPHTGWESALVLGIDVGMMLLAAENSRSNFIWDAFSQTQPARQAVASAFNQVTPLLVGATSRKPATGSASPDLPLNVTGDAEPAVENRQGGPTQLVLNFGANVVKGASFSVTLSSGTVVSSSTSGNALTLDLSGVADAQTLVINVNDVRHFANTAPGNYTLRLGVLLADANQDRSVNLGDFNVVAARFGQSATSSAQGDFNFDGVVNLTDFNLLASQFGKTLAATSSAPSSSPFFAGPSAFGSQDDEDEASTERITDQVLL